MSFVFVFEKKMYKKVYDVIALGGGSGGISFVKKVKQLQPELKVALIDSSYYKGYGGTCVNVGCVPKKIMFSTAQVADTLKYASEYGFQEVKPQLNWSIMKNKRDAYVERLNNIYKKGLIDKDIDLYPYKGTFLNNEEIQLNDVKKTILSANKCINF